VTAAVTVSSFARGVFCLLFRAATTTTMMTASTPRPANINLRDIVVMGTLS